MDENSMSFPDEVLNDGQWLWIYLDPVDNSLYQEEFAMTFDEALNHSADICCQLHGVVLNWKNADTLKII
jgi:hypothetical protein